MVCLGHLPVVPARSSFPTQTHAARGNLQACPIFDDGTRFYEGLAAVKVKSRRGVINAGGDFVIEPTLRNMGAQLEAARADHGSRFVGFYLQSATKPSQPLSHSKLSERTFCVSSGVVSSKTPGSLYSVAPRPVLQSLFLVNLSSLKDLGG